MKVVGRSSCLVDHVVGGFSLGFTLIILISTSAAEAFTKNQKVPYYTVSRSEQNESLKEEHVKCLTLMIAEWDTTPDDYCGRIWDTLMCWPPTPNDTVAVLPCPNYINLFKIDGSVTRTCTENGTWWQGPDAKSNYSGWTNYSQCKINIEVPLIKHHMGRIRMMYNIGYGVSLVSLVAAIITMAYLRLLNCPRNILHINLFLSFMLRATVLLLKENLLVDGLGLPKDVEPDGFGGYSFVEGNGETHWECKLLFIFFNYLLACNYMWIFVEALYLHTLIFVAVFSENSSIKLYIVFGWASPLSFIIPWIIVRALEDDVFCWNVNGEQEYFWIIDGPLICTVVLNFLFFLNILRVLFTKLNTSHTPETRKYRKLAKSTLVLIPLFGVHYIVFVFLPYGVISEMSPVVELVKIYFEMLFNSFEGFLVALLFCFLNGEVQAEIRKRYHRYQLRRGSFRRNTNWHSMSASEANKPAPAHLKSHGIEDKNSSFSPNELPPAAAVVAANGTVGNGTKLTQPIMTEHSADVQSEAQICLVLTKNDFATESKEQTQQSPDESETAAIEIENEDEAANCKEEDEEDEEEEEEEIEEADGLIVHASDSGM